VVTRLEFLGIELDTVHTTMNLSDKRVGALRALLTGVGKLGEKQFTYTELAPLVSKLQFATLVIRHGRAFLRRIIGVMVDTKSQRSEHGRCEHRRLSEEAYADVQWWIALLSNWNANSHSLIHAQM